MRQVVPRLTLPSSFLSYLCNVRTSSAWTRRRPRVSAPVMSFSLQKPFLLGPPKPFHGDVLPSGTLAHKTLASRWVFVLEEFSIFVRLNSCKRGSREEESPRPGGRRGPESLLLGGLVGFFGIGNSGIWGIKLLVLLGFTVYPSRA